MESPKPRPKFKVSEQSTAALNAMLAKNSGSSTADKERAINELKKRGEKAPPLSLVIDKESSQAKDKTTFAKGGMAKDKVTVVSIGVGTMSKKDAKKLAKPKMADGGMAYGKKHMYAAGGSVTMNPGLKALKKASPEAFNKITGK